VFMFYSYVFILSRIIGTFFLIFERVSDLGVFGCLVLELREWCDFSLLSQWVRFF